jgi:hypothetical protein
MGTVLTEVLSLLQAVDAVMLVALILVAPQRVLLLAELLVVLHTVDIMLLLILMQVLRPATLDVVVVLAELSVVFLTGSREHAVVCARFRVVAADLPLSLKIGLSVSMIDRWLYSTTLLVSFHAHQALRQTKVGPSGYVGNVLVFVLKIHVDLY